MNKKVTPTFVKKSAPTVPKNARKGKRAGVLGKGTGPGGMNKK
jgi:hypothetical protein